MTKNSSLLWTGLLALVVLLTALFQAQASGKNEQAKTGEIISPEYLLNTEVNYRIEVIQQHFHGKDQVLVKFVPENTPFDWHILFQGQYNEKSNLEWKLISCTLYEKKGKEISLKHIIFSKDQSTHKWDHINDSSEEIDYDVDKMRNYLIGKLELLLKSKKYDFSWKKEE